MPWCPNCKEEYVEGMTVCNDCGADLVDELPAEREFITFLVTDKEKFAQKFVEFLHYSKVDDVTYEYEEDTQQWAVMIKKEQIKKVKKLYDAFYSVELDQELTKNEGESSSEYEVSGAKGEVQKTFYSETEEIAEDEEDTINDDNGEFTEDPFENDSMFDKEELKEIVEASKKKPTKSSAYVKKEEQYRDLKSTAGTFIVVSVLGIAVLILNGTGVIHIFYGILPNVVMGALFLVFLLIGFQTIISAIKVEKEIDQENSVTEAINNWLTQNVTLEILDNLTSSADSEEVRFFCKLDKMKGMITEQFGELDDSYLDRLVEEFYNSHFEE